MKFSTALSALTAIAFMGTAASQTIVDVAAADSNLSTLVTAVTQAGLVDALSGTGPFTVFAPTNQAFNDTVPAETLTRLLEDMWKPHLTAILEYHVVEGAVTSSDLTDGMMAATLLKNESLTITLNPVEVNGVVVSTPDVTASNGVIHIIDGVLLPSFMSSDIVATAQANADLSTLVELVVAANLVEALQGLGGLTVFAPNNAAFDALGAETLATLKLSENKEQLVDILLYHVVPAVVTSSQLTDGESVNTLLTGEKLTVSLDPVQINDAEVVAADILASNGVIHVIDKVLMVENSGSSTGGDGTSTGSDGSSTGGDGSSTEGGGSSTEGGAMPTGSSSRAATLAFSGLFLVGAMLL